MNNKNNDIMGFPVIESKINSETIKGFIERIKQKQKWDCGHMLAGVILGCMMQAMTEEQKTQCVNAIYGSYEIDDETQNEIHMITDHLIDKIQKYIDIS